MSKKFTEEDFINKLKEKRPNVILLEKYINYSTKILFRCTKCGFEWRTSPKNILSTKTEYCNKCHNLDMKRYSSKEVFVKELRNKNTYLEKIDILGDYKGLKHNVLCKCKECGTTWNPTVYTLQKLKYCPHCKIVNMTNNSIQSVSQNGKCKSKGEIKIKEILDNFNVKYTSQKTFDDLIGINGGLLSYDFYLETYGLLIEYQGQQHEAPINIFGGEDQFKMQQEHDYRKREYAKLNNIKLLEIWYYDYDNIEKLLISILNK